MERGGVDAAVDRLGLDARLAREPADELFGEPLGIDADRLAGFSRGGSARGDGLRRQRGEDEVGYTFRKYGVPYFAVVSCSEAPLPSYALNCEQAEALLRA